ncbi:hypothetical protein [Enterococcus sp. AZ103]|uniref:hypothetical protein n=1 Tax=Enterococcus sp. AZ103 TaxID=2774628 RepID=UPI003F275F3F
MYVKPTNNVEEINFLASAHYQNFTYQADKSYKAGEVYPANDSTAIGIVFNDVTVDTDTGSQPVAIMVEGYVLKDRLTDAPDAAAITAMKDIKFR